MQREGLHPADEPTRGSNRHRPHAPGRVAVHALGRRASGGAHRERREGRPACGVLAAEFPARVLAAAVLQDLDDARRDGDPARVQWSYRQIFSGRPAASRRFDSRLERLLDRSLGRRHARGGVSGISRRALARLEGQPPHERRARHRALSGGPTFGTLEIAVTVDDRKAYTRPWTVTLHEKIVLDTELIEETCLENEQDTRLFKKQ